MQNIEIVKETSTCIYISDIEIILEDGTIYELSNEDVFYFTVRKATGNKTIVIKKLPHEIELIANTLLIRITPQDTKRLETVAYNYDCKIDLKGKGEDVFEIVRGTLVIQSTVTSMGENLDDS